MPISNAAYIQPAPGFIIRHVSFLELDQSLKNATLEWLDVSKDGPEQVLSNREIRTPGCFLFTDCGELLNEEELAGAFENAYCRIEIAKKIHATLGRVDRPMALLFSTVEDIRGGLQFIVLPVEPRNGRLRLLRVAGW